MTSYTPPPELQQLGDEHPEWKKSSFERPDPVIGALIWGGIGLLVVGFWSSVIVGVLWLWSH